MGGGLRNERQVAAGAGGRTVEKPVGGGDGDEKQAGAFGALSH